MALNNHEYHEVMKYSWNSSRYRKDFAMQHENTICCALPGATPPWAWAIVPSSNAAI
jgi:hypothetical protein